MRRSIATVSLSGTLPEKIDAIAAAGFDGIELFEPDFTTSRVCNDLRDLCGERGLAIELFQPSTTSACPTRSTGATRPRRAQFDDVVLAC
jgi:sugar phosphate isomerase/epimerase